MVRQFCIDKTDSALLDKIKKKSPSFEVGPFVFRLYAKQEYVSFPDYVVYDTIHEGVTLSFHINFVDVSYIEYPGVT